MMRYTHAMEGEAQASTWRLRRWRNRRAIQPDGGSSRRRLRLLVLLVVAAISLVLPVVSWLRETPKIEPPFERIVGEGAGPIVEFCAPDVQGAPHTTTEWADRHAIVLFFIATDCPVSNEYAPEMARLAREFGPRGFVFFGIHADPDVTVRVGRKARGRVRLAVPGHARSRSSRHSPGGVRVTPEAVVLLPDGQVIYRGRIDDRYTSDGRQRPEPQVRELRSALEAIVADESPAVALTEPFGCPIPPRTTANAAAESITFAKHVAPILFKNCVSCHRPGEVGPVLAPHLPRRGETGRFHSRRDR